MPAVVGSSFDRDLEVELSSLEEMEWVKPEYSREEVDAAGLALTKPHTTDERPLQIVSNWRSCHSFPLNTMQVYLRRWARELDSDAVVSQRLKRLSSIRHKLERFSSWLTLSEMQDVAGCRAVVNSVGKVRRLVELHKASGREHELADEDDYISKPKKSGYRGHHLIYRYHSKRNQTYNGQKIEIQIRSPLQHAWATAVETVGTFTDQALKSSIGKEEWLRFFALMGSVIARRENCDPIPGTPLETEALKDEIFILDRELGIDNQLVLYNTLVQFKEEFDTVGAFYYLIELDVKERSVTVEGFQKSEEAQASEKYLELERRISDSPESNAVLVSVDNLSELRAAYPNYFLDTKLFLGVLRGVLH